MHFSEKVSDLNLAKSLLRENCENIKFIDENIEGYKELVMFAIRKNANVLEYVSEKLKNDKEVVLFAVQTNGIALKYASDELKDNEEIVNSACFNNCQAFKYASVNFRNNRDFILKRLFYYRMGVLEFASDKIKNDKALILVGVNNNGYVLKFAGDEMKDDKEVVLAAVNNKGDSIKYASERLKNDKDVALMAVSEKGLALEYVSDEMKKDRDVVLTAVRQKRGALVYADDLLRKDKNFILELVKISFNSLSFADESLKSDPEFILEVAKIDARSFPCASASLKNDANFMLEMSKIYPASIKRASNELINNKKFMLNLLKRDLYFRQYVGSELKKDEGFKRELDKIIKEEKIDVEDDKSDERKEMLIDAKRLLLDVMDSSLTIGDYLEVNNIDSSYYRMCINIVKMYDSEFYDVYIEYTSKSSGRAYSILISKAHLFVNLIKNGIEEDGVVRPFDILDYYDKTRIHFDDFYRIVKNKLSNEEIRVLLTFFKKQAIGWINIDDIMSCEDMRIDENGNVSVFLTSDDKRIIFSYIKKKHLPFNNAIYYAIRSRIFNGYMDLEQICANKNKNIK